MCAVFVLVRLMPAGPIWGSLKTASWPVVSIASVYGARLCHTSALGHLTCFASRGSKWIYANQLLFVSTKSSAEWNDSIVWSARVLMRWRADCCAFRILVLIHLYLGDRASVPCRTVWIREFAWKLLEMRWLVCARKNKKINTTFKCLGILSITQRHQWISVAFTMSLAIGVLPNESVMLDLELCISQNVCMQHV